MPKPKFQRADAFDQSKPTLPAADSSVVPYINAGAMNSAVYENGASSFPMSGFEDPVEKENEALKEHVAAVEEEKELWRQQAEELRQQLEAQSNGLTIQGGGLVVQGFQFSPTGLIPPEEITKESWEQVGLLLFRLEGSIQWLLGDWLIYGADLSYGDIKQIAEAMDRDEQTFYNIMSTCRGVESYRRREILSFAHHAEVSKMTPEDQIQALGFAERARFNVKQFRRWIKLGMPETGLPKALPSSTQQQDDDPITLTTGSYVRYFHADPDKAKPQEHKQAVAVYYQMERFLEEYRRKWGIE